MIYHVSKRSAGDFGYLHKGNNHDNSGRAVGSTTRIADLKVNNLVFAALLETDSTQSQRQLDKLEHEAKKVSLAINLRTTNVSKFAHRIFGKSYFFDIEWFYPYFRFKKSYFRK